MEVVVRSFAKINIGLRIGRLREDKFHELATVYQTLAIHDLIRIELARGSGIRIHCNHPGVPTDEGNTCWQVAERVLRALNVRKKVSITIEKNLPVQGGVGSASSNGVAAFLGLEKALKRRLDPADRLRIAAEVGSDLPLFLIGGTVLGAGRGEQVYALEDLPAFECVVATPSIGVSTPAAFAEWDSQASETAKLTHSAWSDRMNSFSHSVYRWLSGRRYSPTGVPDKSWDRAEALLLDLVRAGIENDFERVVFPMYPAIREVKSSLESAGARYASLSGSGSTVYGLFTGKHGAVAAARKLEKSGVSAKATATLRRREYWKKIFVE